MRRSRRVPIVPLALALGIAACGGSTGAPPESSTAPPLASSSSTMTAAATATTTSASTSTTTTTTTTTTTAPGPGPTASGPAGADLKIDQVVDWMHFESLKCGGPVGTWTIVVSGTRTIGGGVTYLLTGVGQATLAGLPTAAAGTFAADYSIEVKGVPLTTGGQDASFQGTADFADGDLTLHGQVSGTSHGESPYRSVILSVMESIETITLTPTAGTYC